MPYVRISVHLVWSTKNREPLLTRELRPMLFNHIQENATAKGISLDTIGGYLDHVHTLISLDSGQTIAKVVQLLKGESSHWVNENTPTGTPFEWQEEYFAVSVSDSAVDNVRAYIRGQEEHHKKKSFGEEYKEFLERYGISDAGLKSL